MTPRAAAISLLAAILAAAVAGCVDTGAPDGDATHLENWAGGPPGPPPMGPGDREGGLGCTITSVFAYAGKDNTFNATVPGPVTPQVAAAWRNASLRVVVASPNGTRVDIPARPFVDHNGSAPRLRYALGRNDTDFLTGVEPGRWYPWRVNATVESSHPRVDNATLLPNGSRELRGWLAVWDGPDDRLVVTLEGARLPAEVVGPRVPLPGGRFTVEGHGLCAG